ncbi:MAG TPA: lysophospholipid acyltransferase family protein [Thermoflexales bacterium]|nr:lysophospholipid acyltransferase family protein [Thermoflexales bacterium]
MAEQTEVKTEGKKSKFTKRWAWNKPAPRRAFYNWWLRLAQKAFMRFRVVGLENVPQTGGAIVAINHINFWDPLVVMPSLGRPVIPMTKVEAWEAGLKWFVDGYGAIPVHRGAVDTAAIRSATEALNEGQLVLISPEGTRSKTGALQHAQEGMAFLATRADALILPVAIQGTPRILKRLFAPVTITVGKPFKLDLQGQKPTREVLSALTTEAMKNMAALLPEEMRGVYSV